MDKNINLFDSSLFIVDIFLEFAYKLDFSALLMLCNGIMNAVVVIIFFIYIYVRQAFQERKTFYILTNICPCPSLEYWE